MNNRFVLSMPNGESVTRDVLDGRWVEPHGGTKEEFGGSLFALPGLVDAHAHLASAELNFQPGVYEDAVDRARAALRAGVTLVLDKGWTDTTTLEVISNVPAAERPEIEAAARILASPDGYYPNFAREVEAEDFVEAVGEEARAGAGWVKLIGDWPRRGMGAQPNFTQAQIEKAVEVAVSIGARVAIHTMAPDVPSAAVAAGVHSVEHGLFLTESDLAALGGRRGMWVPTVLRNEATLAQLGPDSSGGRLFVEGLENLKRLLPLALEAGVHVLAGTDLVGAPADVAAEAIRLGEYGLNNTQVVGAVTSAAFVGVGRSASFEPGAPADAVYFAENPVDNLEVLRHPAAIVRLGNLV